MSETVVPAAESVVAAEAAAFRPLAAMGSVAFSLFINGFLPFATYKLLAPHFAKDSILPLLYASGFPVLGLVVGLVRTRAVDAIAIFALFGIVYNIATTLLAGEVHLALVLGSTQGFLIAGAFLVSALIDRPIIYFIARQFFAGEDAGARERFELVNKADGRRTVFVATMAWAAGIGLLGVAGLILAMTLAPATYLLVNNIVNTVVNVGLVVWTIRFMRTRLMAVGERLLAASVAAP
ncbi:MAG: hypothetical protein JOZ55_03535 [Alphaproteobacteria bacterium]|nr:hypothetical protein [Alphaproteobacteria bacterium]